MVQLEQAICQAMGDTATMKWSIIAMLACAIGLAFWVGRASSPPIPPAPTALRVQASTPPGGKVRTQSKKTKGVSYDGIEYEVERSKRDFDRIDRIALEVRKKQPIWFLGVPMRQIPSDNWLMSELIFRIKPDYIIEAGTLYGGSALYYAAVLELINPDGKVITIDINEEQIHAKAKAHDLWKRRVKFIEGSSTAADVIEQIKEEVGDGKTVFITLDTLHAPNHVSKELELYSQFVSKGSYIVLQDTFYEGLPEAVEKFLVSHPGFRRDTELDRRFVFTKYRGGFLKRQ
jgi:cephalosporin hydroxylase